MQSFLKPGPAPAHFPDPVSAKILHDIACGLYQMMQMGCVHRDMTIDNVLLYINQPAKENRAAVVDGDGNDGDHARTSITPAEITAKIHDFGVSGRLHDQKSGPRGSMRHYAPEACEKRPALPNVPANGGYYTTACDVSVDWVMCTKKKKEIRKTKKKGKQKSNFVMPTEIIASFILFCSNPFFFDKSQVFMLGTLMYDMTLSFQFGGAKGAFYHELSVSECIQRVAAGELPKMPEWVDSRFAALYQRCCAVDPAERPKLQEIISILEGYWK